MLGVGQGDNGEIVDVVDMKLSDVVKLIRGKRGTVVRLKVLPAQRSRTEDLQHHAGADRTDRQRSPQPDHRSRSQAGRHTLQDRRDRSAQLLHGHGRLPRRTTENFKSTTRDVARLLEKFNKEKVDAVVLDLRRNGGGSLTESISLTGLFIDSGPVVQVKDSDKRVQHYDDPDRGMLWSGPLVVLTSKFSASASEIFAGAIQDYHRGLVVGDKSTHGKGTVQSLLDLGKDLFHIPNAQPLGALKITIQQFYRPNGDSTQNRGVLADVELPSITSHLDIGESSYDYALKFDHVPQVPYRPYDLVKSEMVQEPEGQFGQALRGVERLRQVGQEHRPLRRAEESQDASRSTKRSFWPSGPRSTPTRKRKRKSRKSTIPIGRFSTPTTSIPRKSWPSRSTTSGLSRAHWPRPRSDRAIG